MKYSGMRSYHSKNKIRIVTAASLFDGHDAAINIMRRIMQASGAEIIHLGHNRSVREIVRAAIQEDAQAIAITSYMIAGVSSNSPNALGSPALRCALK